MLVHVTGTRSDHDQSYAEVREAHVDLALGVNLSMPSQEISSAATTYVAAGRDAQLKHGVSIINN